MQTFIEVPKKLAPRQQELLRELAEIEHVDVTPQRRSFFERIKEYFSLPDEAGDQAEEKS